MQSHSPSIAIPLPHCNPTPALQSHSHIAIPLLHCNPTPTLQSHSYIAIPLPHCNPTPALQSHSRIAIPLPHCNPTPALQSHSRIAIPLPHCNPTPALQSHSRIAVPLPHCNPTPPCPNPFSPLFPQVFPGLTPHLVTLPYHFVFPFYRDYALSTGEIRCHWGQLESSLGLACSIASKKMVPLKGVYLLLSMLHSIVAVANLLNKFFTCP